MRRAELCLSRAGKAEDHQTRRASRAALPSVAEGDDPILGKLGRCFRHSSTADIPARPGGNTARRGDCGRLALLPRPGSTCSCASDVDACSPWGSNSRVAGFRSRYIATAASDSAARMCCCRFASGAGWLGPDAWSTAPGCWSCC